MAITTIKIVRTLQQPFENFRYMVHPLARHWLEQGLDVQVAHALREPAGEDVLILPHFDLTVRPASFVDSIARSAHVVNRDVIDVSKRRISGQLVTAPDEYDGPVLVKSNRNFGGWPESKVRAAAGTENAPRAAFLHWSDYKVYDHPRQVPHQAWTRRQLVVEKFLPEKEDGLFCLRQYIFLGDREIYTRALSPLPIVKSGNVVRREVLAGAPPEEVQEVRRRLGFDYGKFDFVIHDGKPIVFDVNPTPTFNPKSKAGSQDELIAHLAEGMRSLLVPG